MYSLNFFQRFGDLTLLAQECTNPIRAVRNFRNSYRGQVELSHAFWLRQAGLAQLHAIRFTIPEYVGSVLEPLRPRARGFYNSFMFEEMEQPPQAERRRIVSVGGLKDMNKNGMVAAEAFASIAKRHPEWTLEFFGDSRFDEELKRLTEATGLGDRIISRGVVHDLDALYKGAAISVMTSFEEGNPNVVNEGMAYGVPTIGFSDCQGVTHLIDHRGTGILVSRDNEVSNLAAAMEELIGSVALRERIEQNGYRTVVRRCDHDQYIDQWNRTLELAKERRAAEPEWRSIVASLDEFFDVGMDAYRREEDRIAWTVSTPDVAREKLMQSRAVNRKKPRRSGLPWRRRAREFRAAFSNWRKDQLRALGFHSRWSTSWAALGWSRFGAYDRVVLHDVLGILAALWLAGGRPSRIVLDICETPNLRGRTTQLFVRSWIPWYALYQWTAKCIGRRCAGALLQSPDLADVTREHFKQDGLVWAHVRNAEALSGLEAPRRVKKDSEASLLVAWPSDFNEATGSEFALDLIDFVGPDMRMVFIGAKIRPTMLRDMRRAYGKQITTLDRMDEAGYLAMIKECDVALIAFSPDFENTQLCIPNRFLDCLQVGVPVVSTPHDAVKRVLDAHPENGIVTLTRDVHEVSEALLEARRLTPGRLDHQAISDALGGVSDETAQAVITGGDAKKIAVIAQRDVTDRPRFRQLIEISRQTGAKVEAYARGRGGWVVDSDGAFLEDARRQRVSS